MKETALAHMEVPEEARLISTHTAVQNYTSSASSYTSDPATSTFLGWISWNYAGTGITAATGYASNFLENAMPLVQGVETPLTVTAAIVGTATGISILVNLIGMTINTDTWRGINVAHKKSAKPITEKEWVTQKTGKGTGYTAEKNALGFRVRNRSNKSALITALMPKRMFKKTLIAETIWYDPSSDTFTRESEYMGFRKATKVVEKFAGRRQAFKTALDSL